VEGKEWITSATEVNRRKPRYIGAAEGINDPAVDKESRGTGATVGWAWRAVAIRRRVGRKTPPG